MSNKKTKSHRNFSKDNPAWTFPAIAIFAGLAGFWLLYFASKGFSPEQDFERVPAGNTLALMKARGTPAEYDPGPPKNSDWARLFGETPNYRGIGAKLLGMKGGEKFRWIFGPMWYRGRLQPNQVKVFVVGQEGAQDENVSNRAFTGSTGTKTQKFLNHLGIRSSYLFLNTFVYTINGQLEGDPKFKWMEQHVDSPVVQFRHKLFNHMAETNPDSLALVIGVGAGGKASVATWVNANGGTCSADRNLANCDTSGVEKKFRLRRKLLVVGVPHPGGANPNLGGQEALNNIIRGFTAAGKRVAARIKQDDDWLPVDNGARRGNLDADYRYGNAPVPFMDFAFGTNWRMGGDGTSSNRQGADSIQVFSDDGVYSPPKNLFTYPPLPDVLAMTGNPIPEMPKGDVPYESPKYHEEIRGNELQYDYGPCGDDSYSCDVSKLLQGQVSGYQWPDFKALGVTEHPSFGHGPIYRGRLGEARVLVLADQESHDDIFSTRAMTGESGQRFQGFLRALGITKSYAIVRTLPVDTLDLDESARMRIALDPQVTKVRNKILETILGEKKTELILAVGPIAKGVIMQLANPGVPVVNVPMPVSNNVNEQGAVIREIAKVVKLTVDEKPTKLDGAPVTIPRIDMPIHTRWWMGTSGNRARRPNNNETKQIDPNHYMVSAPRWVTRLRPPPYDGSFDLSGVGSIGGSDEKDPESDAGSN